MPRRYGSGHLYVKSGSYYARWRTPDGRYVNRRVGRVRSRAGTDGLTRTEAERALRRMIEAEAMRTGKGWRSASGLMRRPSRVPLPVPKAAPRGPGRPNRLFVHTPDGRSTRYGKATAVPLPAGTRIELLTGGGGGWGDPSLRSADSLRRDVDAGYISEAAAARDWR